MKLLEQRLLIGPHSRRRIIQQFEHPFLMDLHWAFQTSDKMCLVIDYYCDENRLFYHLRKNKRFSESQAQLFIGQIIQALGYLHSIDIIYRQLKLENVFLDDYGHICLSGFDCGLLTIPRELKNGDVYGFYVTPEYIAPEIVCNSSHDKNVDWWALGILLYELTVGLPPFYSQNINQFYRNIQQGPLLFPPNLSFLCKDLITKVLVIFNV